LSRELGGGRLEGRSVRQALAELNPAVAVDVGLHALNDEVGVGAPERRLHQEEEVAGLSELGAVLEREGERDGALGIGGVGAGVDVDVVVRQPRHARDDALHLLIGRVGLDEDVLGLAEQLLGLTAALLQQSGVVEVDRLREVVVLRADLLHPVGLLGELGAVVDEIVLDGRELRSVGRRLGRRVVALVAATTGADRTQREHAQTHCHPPPLHLAS